jgi:chromosome segregation ATPase
MHAELEAASAELNVREQMIQELQAIEQKLIQQIEILTESETKNLAQIQNLEQQCSMLANIQSDLAESQGLLELSKGRIQELELDAQRLQDQMNTQVSERERLTSELYDLKGQYNQSTQELQHERQRCNELSQELCNIQAVSQVCLQYDQLLSFLISILDFFIPLLSLLQAQCDSLADAEMRLSQSQQEHSRTSAALASVREELSASESRERSLQQQLQEAVTACQDEKRRVADVQSEHQAMQALLEKMQSEHEHLEKNLRDQVFLDAFCF